MKVTKPKTLVEPCPYDSARFIELLKDVGFPDADARASALRAARETGHGKLVRQLRGIRQQVESLQRQVKELLPPGSTWTIGESTIEVAAMIADHPNRLWVNDDGRPREIDTVDLILYGVAKKGNAT